MKKIPTQQCHWVVVTANVAHPSDYSPGIRPVSATLSSDTHRKCVYRDNIWHTQTHTLSLLLSLSGESSTISYWWKMRPSRKTEREREGSKGEDRGWSVGVEQAGGKKTKLRKGTESSLQLCVCLPASACVRERRTEGGREGWEGAKKGNRDVVVVQKCERRWQQGEESGGGWGMCQPGRGGGNRRRECLGIKHYNSIK